MLLCAAIANKPMQSDARKVVILIMHEKWYLCI